MTEDNAKIFELEQRIHALEIGKQFDSNKDAVRNIEEEYLYKLREIQLAIQQEQQQGGSSSNGNVVVEELQKENELLKQKNNKLEYRVQHMITYMEQMYEEIKQLKNKQHELASA